MPSTAQLETARHVRFNASEVLEIAEQIKCNASRFYYETAESFADLDIRNVLLEFADWETKYEGVFTDMRKQLSKQGREIRASEFEYDTLPNVRAMAGLTVFAVKPYPQQELTGRETKQEILKKAVEKEMDILVFFHGLKDHFARDQAARDKIDDIINEQMHLISVFSAVNKNLVNQC